MADINGSPKGIVYKHIVAHFDLQLYLSKPIPSLNKKQISREDWLLTTQLAVESGRPNNV